MTANPLPDRIAGQPPERLAELPPDPRAHASRDATPDLHRFFDHGPPLEQRPAPARSRSLAASLHDAIMAAVPEDAARASLLDRLVTDDVLRGEADRDQNVYLGRLFTRTLTRAVPDLVFLPANALEVAEALRWARAHSVPVALRGAASTAMGGAVPNDGGLALDLTRLDDVEVDVRDRVCVVGAGARLREIHRRLAERGFALSVYPSNLGGTLAGWFVTGGIGLNAFGRGRALDFVRAADVLLPSGEHVRLHDDGRLDVPDGSSHRRTLQGEEREAWFAERGIAPMALADLAGSEGVLGAVTQLTVAIEPRPAIGAFLLSFAARDEALEAAAWVARESGQAFGAPANLKLLSGSHVRHARRVWLDEEAREWRRHPGTLGTDEQLPWRELRGAGGLGARPATLDHERAGAYLYVDFLDLDAARTFAGALDRCPGAPRVLDEPGTRFARERFRPQQIKRLGPGLLAAEIVLPAAEVPSFLAHADRMARNAGAESDVEVYYLRGGEALAIAGTLTDHRRGAFAVDLVLAPALVDLAMARHRGRPYVLGRWQSVWARRALGGARVRGLTAWKRALDPRRIVNRGVLLGPGTRGPLGAFFRATFAPGVSLARGLLGAGALAGTVRAARAVLGLFPGPAHGRGEPASIGAEFRPAPAGGAERPAGDPPAATPQAASARALHCVNCGECNSVCPIFHESGIRLPQMLTHLAEASHAGAAVPASGGVLLDLCMRCGNCEQVCQAGIPHLPLYEELQARADAARPRDRERHLEVLAAVRGSSRYLRGFLDVRPGGYHKRTPASLPGVTRFVLLRAENDAGPAATCVHCGACVAVCPTEANREFEAADPRWITTEQARCIGCGTCVEVCPANHLNGGRTLRVFEAPTPDWFVALDELERTGGR